MKDWATNHLGLTSPESMSRFNRVKNDPATLANDIELRKALLDFIADFANWDNARNDAFLATARGLTQSAHSTLGDETRARPLIVDPFAGGGSIPLESVRVGAEAFASDLNPIPVLLNKVLLEKIPRYGAALAERLRQLGSRVRDQAADALSDLYPRDQDGSHPIAYFWARTIRCEGPGCGVAVPLIRATSLSNRAPLAHITIAAKGDEIRISLNEGREQRSTATIRGGKATCPKCEYTTPETNVKAQLVKEAGGADTSRLFAVLVQGRSGRRFRLPTSEDFLAVDAAKRRLRDIESRTPGRLPNEAINPIRPYKNTVGVCIVTRLGIQRFRDLYTARQLCTLLALQDAIVSIPPSLMTGDVGLNDTLRTLLFFVFDRIVNANSSLSRWNPKRSTIEGLFSKQALQVMWDFTESNPLGPGMANWDGSVEWIAKVIEENASLPCAGTVQKADARHCPLPDDSCDFLFTDPPYFAAIPYADLSDVFYVWMKRSLAETEPTLFDGALVQKEPELVVTNSARGPSGEPKDAAYFSHGMAQVLSNARRFTKPSGIGSVVFADSSTSSWEAILGAVIDGGWVMTASWPIDTELQNRTRAGKSSSLQSSVFMVCRPRESQDGSLRANDVGDWREILTELPSRIHDWMPRLAEEGVVGADAIFACLGPALEVFSRYSRVEKASGEVVKLREYLEQVWAAVSTEALSMIFRDADAAGLESDARFTAIVLWTLGAGGSSGSESHDGDAEDEDDDEDEDTPKGNAAKGSYSLEYDAARKIAQGLGVNLEQIESVVEVKGNKARLLPVSERAATLFGKAEKAEGATKKRGKKATQKKLFNKDAEEDGGKTETVTLGDGAAATPGVTALDRVHQAMLLFGDGRADALKRFIVEDGVGGDARFWKLAQSLSALYPAGSEEKRWVDGVLARKKSFGF